MERINNIHLRFRHARRLELPVLLCPRDAHEVIYDEPISDSIHARAVSRTQACPSSKPFHESMKKGEAIFHRVTHLLQSRDILLHFLLTLSTKA